jgi:DNA-directed RNA polymerase subunit RPC12/RpoP
MSFYVKSRFHDVLEKCMWRTWFDLNMKVWKHEAWAWMYICNDCGAEFASNVKVKIKWAEVISIMKVKEVEVVSIMNSMGRSCPLLWC